MNYEFGGAGSEQGKFSQQQNRSSTMNSCQSLLAWNSREHLFPITIVWAKPIAQQLTVLQKIQIKYTQNEDSSLKGYF